MTKKEAKARKEAWNKAIDEGRALRFGNGQYFKSYPTIEACHAALAEAKAAGFPCNIIVKAS